MSEEPQRATNGPFRRDTPTMPGLAGIATYFVSLGFLGSIGAGAKSFVAQALEVLLIVLGPPWACLVSLRAMRLARRERRWRVVLAPLLTVCLIMVSWLVLLQSYLLMRKDIEKVRERVREQSGASTQIIHLGGPAGGVPDGWPTHPRGGWTGSR